MMSPIIPEGTMQVVTRVTAQRTLVVIELWCSKWAHTRHGLVLGVVFLANCLATASLLAGPTATLTGRVTDLSGAGIAGVKIEERNVETNVVYMGATNTEGFYNISNLPPGIYRVIVEKFAYKTFIKCDV